MRTTVELPDDLIRAVKARAVEENLTFKEMVAVLLREGLAQSKSVSSQVGYRVKLPLFKGGHPAKPGEELTPERIHEILLQQEVDSVLGR